MPRIKPGLSRGCPILLPLLKTIFPLTTIRGQRAPLMAVASALGPFQAIPVPLLAAPFSMSSCIAASRRFWPAISE